MYYTFNTCTTSLFHSKIVFIKDSSINQIYIFLYIYCTRYFILHVKNLVGLVFSENGKNLPRRRNNTEDISLWTKFVLLIVYIYI
jgi:hypothetical protein